MILSLWKHGKNAVQTISYRAHCCKAVFFLPLLPVFFYFINITVTFWLAQQRKLAARLATTFHICYTFTVYHSSFAFKFTYITYIPHNKISCVQVFPISVSAYLTFMLHRPSMPFCHSSPWLHFIVMVLMWWNDIASASDKIGPHMKHECFQ